MSDSPGHVYVIYNPVWAEWVKVGCVFGTAPYVEQILRSRLSNINVSDPHNGFAIKISCAAACARTAETYAHGLLSVHHIRGKGEWFKCSVEVAQAVVENACRIARWTPHRRKSQFERAMEEERVRVPQMSTARILQEISEVVETARAAREVIKSLLEMMATPDERLEGAAETVMRKLSALSGDV